MKTRLQELRKAAGFKSAKAFADYFGINLNTYTGYEQGKPISLEQAWAFADEFDVSLDELAGRERPKREYSNQRRRRSTSCTATWTTPTSPQQLGPCAA